MPTRRQDAPKAAARVQDHRAAASPVIMPPPATRGQREAPAGATDAGLIPSAGDTSARTQTERATEERARFFTLSLDLLCMFGLDGYVKDVNPACERTLGYTVEELRAEPFLHFVHPDDQAATVAEGAKLARGVSTRSFGNRYRCKDGTYRRLLWNAVPVPAEARIYAIARDITEVEREATLARGVDALAEDAREALARTAVTLAEKAVTQAQDNRDLTRSNTALEVQAELARVADTLAQDTREALARTAVTLAEKAVTQAQDNRDLTRSNTALEVQAELARVADALAQDAREALARTAVMLAEKAVTQAQDNRELTRSNNALQLFASVASHDLQEPLRKIQAFGDRLKKSEGDALSPQGQDYLERMQGAASRMQELINALLTYARLTASTARFVPVNLASVAREVLSDLEAQIERSGGRVEVGLLPTLDADSVQMRQLLQNLLSNALKFHRPEQPPVVALSAEILPSDGPGGALCRLVVQDNGIGFEEKHAERIFGIFERLHGRGTYDGTGIGLALCRQIVERHGGHMTATSAPGQGASFVMTLPLNYLTGAPQ